MGVKSMKTGRVEIDLQSRAKLKVDPEQVFEAPGGLYPVHTKAFEMDEYRMMQGWPVPVPPHDIQCNTMISGTGEVFGERDDNTSIITGALIRWVADATYYDETALEWRPIQDGTGVQNAWTTSVDYAPVLIHDYEYRVNNERFIESVLNFDSDTRNHMWADFSATIGGSTGYTVIMVMSPNSIYGNDDDVPYNGLWCPGDATPVGDTFDEDPEGSGWAKITVQGGFLYFQTHGEPRTRAISIQQQLNSNAPMYLAFVISPIESQFYVGFGSQSIRVAKLPTGTSQDPIYNGIVLGRSTGDVLHTADMALFDLGIYASRLTPAEVRNEFAILSRSYGGSE